MGHFDQLLTDNLQASTAITDFVYLKDRNSDTAIIELSSGAEYWYGTADGKPGSTDSDNAITFALPTPRHAGEKLTVNFSNNALIAKLVGITVVDEANVNITYIATEDGSKVEVASTATGVHGTANTMVKINASHVLIGDRLECVATSTTNWLMKVVSEGGTLVAADIAVDPGNAGGYID